MANLKLKVKKTLMKLKVNGVLKTGYYGRVITNGTKSFEDIIKASTHGSTLDYREAELACKMMIDGIADSIIDELSRIIEPQVTMRFTDPSRAVTIQPIDPLYQGEEITMLLMPMLVNED